jgi:hypothetical protein
MKCNVDILLEYDIRKAWEEFIHHLKKWLKIIL